MNSRKLLNLGLLVLVAGLGIIVMLDFSTETDVPEPKKISDLKATEINQISIALSSDKHTLLKKPDNQWHIIDPIEIPANDIQVFGLLSLLNTISYGQYKVAEADLAKYGLSPPSITISFNQYNFAIGDENPMNHRRYILFNNTIHLITDHYSSIAKSAPSGLISLAILPENRKITSLHLPEMKLDLVDGSWLITPPPASPVSQDTIHKLVDEWQFAQALNVSILGNVETPEMKYKSIHIEFGDDLPAMNLLAFATGNKILLTNPTLGVQYHLTSNASTGLFQFHESKDVK